MFISSIFLLRNNAWGFKKPNTSFNIQISLNRFSASHRNRSIVSILHLLISSTAERPTPSACSPGIFFFLRTRRSSIGISCFSQILITVIILCLTSALRSLTKKAIKAFILCNSFPVTNLFAVNIFGYHKILLEFSSKIVKEKQRKIAELHPMCHELLVC